MSWLRGADMRCRHWSAVAANMSGSSIFCAPAIQAEVGLTFPEIGQTQLDTLQAAPVQRRSRPCPIAHPLRPPPPLGHGLGHAYKPHCVSRTPRTLAHRARQ